MPSGRTSMLAPQATDLLAIHPPYSEKQRSQPCRLPHERKLGDQTKDDADKEPREERSCGRSQTSLYNEARTHLSLEKDAPVSRAVDRAGHILCRPTLGRASPICPDLIYDRHTDGANDSCCDPDGFLLHRSRASLGLPQSYSVRDGSNTRS